MSKLQGVVAVILRRDRFLVGKRSPDKEVAPGYWCPPSGKIEAGESEEHAVEREVREETGLEVEAERKLTVAETRDKSTILHWWLVREIGEGDPRPNHEHSELRWVTLAELRELQPSFPEDLEILSAVEARGDGPA